jgi:ATP phosphoribosyltransferase
LKNIDIKEIKDTIKSEFPELYSELHLENIDSLAQLKQAFVSFLKEKEEEKEEKIKEFKKKINLLIQKNKKAASEKDEKVKAILSFLNKI